MTIEQIVQRGAEARAHGVLDELDNPYYKRENMPIATGESAEEWSAKAEAWLSGFKLEDAIRG
jgi:hypothetical protein